MTTLMYKLLALGGIIVGLFLLLWFVHHTWWEEGYQQAISQQKQEAAKIIYKQGKITTRTIIKYKIREKIIYKKGKLLIKKVPIYVTLYDNSRCTINNGFVRLWNASNQNAIPKTSKGTNENPSKVTLTQVAIQHSKEALLYWKTSSQLIALQNWIRLQEKVTNK